MGSRTKFTIEEVRKIFEDAKCELITNVYKGVDYKLKYKAQCKHENETTLYLFKKGHGILCKKCSKEESSKKQRLSIEYLKEEFEKAGCKLLSDKYEGSSKKLQYVAKCGCTDWIKWSDFRVSKHKKCSNCIINKQKTHDEFVKEVYDIFGSEYDVLGEYVNSYTKVLIRHNECGNTYETYPNNILRKYRCMKCYGNSKKTHEQFVEQLYEKYKDEYTAIEEYKNAKTKIKVKHNNCGYEYYVIPKQILSGKGCPLCKSSKGERRVAKWLDNANLKYDRQHDFDNLTGVSGGQLKYDFVILDKDNNIKCIIEYDGEYHFQPIQGKSKLKIQQEHDRRKNEYCVNNNIWLLRIPYWQFDKIEEILDRELNNNK